jgi:hypothetical protein
MTTPTIIVPAITHDGKTYAELLAASPSALAQLKRANPALFAQLREQPSYAGKTWAQMLPGERVQLKRANPALYDEHRAKNRK